MGTGSKLVVRVLNAKNLMPKGGQGSSSAFVQVVFDGQRKSTRSIARELNPVWDETLEFPISDFTDMLNEILEIDIIHNSRRSAGKRGKFLGRVCVHGSTFAKKGEEQLNYYRLDKRGLFSLVRGEIGLIIYYIVDESDGNGSAAAAVDERGELHLRSTGANVEREVTGVLKSSRAAVIAERGASSVQRVAKSPQRVAPKGEKGGSFPYRVPENAASCHPNGATGGSDIAENAEEGALRSMELELERKSSPANAEAKREHSPKYAPKSVHAYQIQPPPVPIATQSYQHPLHAAPSTGPPPTRRPPTVRFSLPPPALASDANESSQPMPNPQALPANAQEHIRETSISSQNPLPSSVPNVETHKKPPPQPDEAHVADPQESTIDALPMQLMPEAWIPTSVNVVEPAPTLTDSQEETLIVLSPWDNSLPIEGTTTDPQTSVEDLEAMSLEEEIQLDAKPTIARFGDGIPYIDVPPNVEALQPSDNEADGVLEDVTPVDASEMANDSDLVEEMPCVSVQVVKARSLTTRGVSIHPHPYIQVVLGNQHAKTKAIPNSLEPEWNEVFALGSSIDTGTLEVSLWDHKPPPMQDTLLGTISFDLSDIPKCMPPTSPLAPQWYALEHKQDDKGSASGDIMLSVWMGTQNDGSISNTWHLDTARHHLSTRPKIYLSPKLWYLRLKVIEAQDLQTPDTPRRLPEASVKVQLGFQTARTRVAKRRSVSPFWNEDLMLVASEPLQESFLLIVEDHQGSGKHEPIGFAQISLEEVEKRIDDRQVDSRWFSLQTSSDMSDAISDFQGRVHIRVFLEGGYHVMDEAAHLTSDTRPSAKQLWKAPIGVLELGILGAQNLLPMKNKEGHGTTDAYCVAKYGPKWVRTRTILDTLSPRWNERYTWEVYDPCTVLTLCVFDNGDLEYPQHQQTKHMRIGKVRVRLSMLEVERAYTISYPLMVLQPGGLKKMGDMKVAIRFSCMSMFSLIHTYTKPLLPRMHYLHPIPMQQQEILRTASMQMVALRLSRVEPPLKLEVVQYMLDADSQLWSMRRSKAHWYRISHMLGGFYAILTWMKDIRQWRNPVTTLLVHFLFVILLCYPELILPTIFFYMFLIGLWQFRTRSRSPPHIDPRLSQADITDRDDLDEEFDTQPTSKPSHIVKLRYERLRGIAGRIQMVMGDIATQGERVHGLLTWRDPHATSIFVLFCFFTAVWLYVAPFKLAAFLLGLHFLRHPRFRDPLPSILLNFFQRLPAQSDRIL